MTTLQNQRPQLIDYLIFFLKGIIIFSIISFIGIYSLNRINEPIWLKQFIHSKGLWDLWFPNRPLLKAISMGIFGTLLYYNTRKLMESLRAQRKQKIRFQGRDWHVKENEKLMNDIEKTKDKTVIIITGEPGQGMSYLNHSLSPYNQKT